MRMPILNWLNNEQAVTTAKNCSYRLLNQVPELSCGDQDSDNMLFQRKLILTEAAR